MGYYSNEEESQNFRIGILALISVIFAGLVFLVKINACENINGCKDEFHTFGEGMGARTEFVCEHGASAEVVSSPPAPKPGVLCHCPSNPSNPSQQVK